MSPCWPGQVPKCNGWLSTKADGISINPSAHSSPPITAMKQHTTEEVIIASCLAIGWAIATVVRELLVPLVSLVLTAAGWKPARTAAIELPRETTVNNVTPITTAHVIRATNFRTLKAMLAKRGIDCTGMTRQQIVEQLEDLAFDDRFNSVGPEALTAEQRNPSLGRRA
jgi:hypothetical protein